MEKIKVAVFPCGSEVGLEINRSLRFSRHFELIGLNSVTDHGRTVYKNYIGNLPSFKKQDFLSKIKDAVRNEQIRFLIPAMDEIGSFLKENESQLGCEVVCADEMNVLISKSKTYERLKGIIRLPKIYNEYEEIKRNLPVFTKPDVGYGSRNTELINTEEQLKKRWEEKEGLLFCEYLPGTEYTIDCFSDKEGKVLYAGARERKRIRMGISVNTLPVKLKEIEGIAQQIGRELKLQGIWFFQLKKNRNGELALLEVASRVSGSMALNRLKGVNFILLELFQRLGYPVSIQQNDLPDMELERSFDCKLMTSLKYDTVYVDFDDCLIINQKLNTELIRFLFQQINKRKKIVLLTKHDGDLKERLEKLKINSLFDKIVHIHKDEDKYHYIEDKNSIFIDDSHQERQEVIENLSIPAFAPDVIGSLIDYREL